MPYLEKKERTGSDGKKRVTGWYATFKDTTRSPSRKTVSLRTKDASAARARLAQLEFAYAQGTFDPWTDKLPESERITADEAVRRFMASRKETGSGQGVATYRHVIGPFARTLPPGLVLTQIERRHVDAWLSSKDWSESTVKSYADRLRIFAAWCIEAGLAPASWKPVPKVGRGKQSRREDVIRFFDESQLRQIRAALSARIEQAGASASAVDGVLSDAIPFAAGTGLRRGELCALRWANVHVGTGGAASFVRVANTDAFTTKSGRERTVPLVGDALDAVLRRQKERRTKSRTETVFPSAKGEQMNGPYLGKRFRMLLAEAGVDGIVTEPSGGHNFHSLRHTFGTMAINRGVDVFQLKEIMGHADVKTTLKYARLRPVTLATAMQRAFGSGLDSSPFEGPTGGPNEGGKTGPGRT